MYFHGRWDFTAFRDEIIESERANKSAPVHQTDAFARIVNGPIVGGHIHTGDTNGRVHYTSSLTRWKYGEEDTKGFIITTHEPGTKNFTVEKIVNPMAIEFITLHVTSGKEHEAYQQACELRNRGKRVKLRTSDITSLHVLRQITGSDTGIKVENKTSDSTIYEIMRRTHASRFDEVLERHTNDHVNMIIEFDRLLSVDEARVPLTRNVVEWAISSGESGG
jgi:hypothetical protein